jgi:hypothetical protein
MNMGKDSGKIIPNQKILHHSGIQGADGFLAAEQQGKE